MRKLLVLFFVFRSIALLAIDSIEDQVNQISKLISTHPDSAYSLGSELLTKSNSTNNDFGIVQSNYILAYLNEQKGDYGKAIIYYLESIRHAEKSSYKDVSKTLASLYKNCGVIFRKFKAFELAEEYYLSSLEYAIKSNDLNQQLSINYNLARVYRESGDEILAIEILEKYLPLTEKLSPMYFDYMNRLALSYYEVGEFQKSININEAVINQIGDLDDKMKSYSYHNLAKSLKEIKNYKLSEYYYDMSIALTLQIKNRQQLFFSYYSKGLLFKETNRLSSAIPYFVKAESIIPELKNDPDYFKIYNDMADIYFNLKDFSKSKTYQDLYFSRLNTFLELQNEFQENNRRDNIDLITKRYLDEIKKQEKIASILFYSRITSGGLLLLLLFVIGYNRYEKIRVRKSIERQLVKLEILE